MARNFAQRQQNLRMENSIEQCCALKFVISGWRYSGSRDGVSRSRGPSVVATNRERRQGTIPRGYSFSGTALNPWPAQARLRTLRRLNVAIPAFLWRQCSYGNTQNLANDATLRG
jgi:hypothetical protein